MGFYYYFKISYTVTLVSKIDFYYFPRFDENKQCKIKFSDDNGKETAQTYIPMNVRVSVKKKITASPILGIQCDFLHFLSNKHTRFRY